jgi:hypothetical protein
MRDNAARALRVEDDMPRLADLKAVTPDMPLPYEFPRDRRFSRESEADVAVATLTAVPSEAEPAPGPAPEPPRPRSAPGRAYGSHRRGETAAGYQPGRRTVEITGQAAAPRRRSHTETAFVAKPDRAALWAFLLALFLVAMAVATASPGA